MARFAVALLSACMIPLLSHTGRAGEVVRVAIVPRQPDDWLAAGVARATLAELSGIRSVLPANAAMAQRLVPVGADAPVEQVAAAGRALRCRFVVVVEGKGRGEVAADLTAVAAKTRTQVVAQGQLHELPGLLALAVSRAMRLRVSKAEQAKLAAPAVSSEAAAEAQWRGDAAQKPEEQIALYEAALKSNAQSALLHNQLGAALARAGQAGRALEEFTQAIRLAPDYAAAHTNRGLLLKQEKRWDEAEVAFRTAIRLGPKSPTPHVGLARLLDRLGSIIAAVEQLETAVEVDPSHVDTLLTLSDSYFESYNLRAARRTAERVLELEPDNFTALNTLGILQLVPHDYEKAELAFLRALTAKPDDPEALANLGLALYGQGKTEVAIGVLQRATTLHPDYPTAHLYLGRIYLAEKRPDEAAAALQRAAELRPAMAPAQRGLQSARAAVAAQRAGCGCPSIEDLLGPKQPMTAQRAVGCLLPAVVLLAPHAVRLARRRRR